MLRFFMCACNPTCNPMGSRLKNVKAVVTVFS